MQILRQPVAKEQLLTQSEIIFDEEMVKAVVDVGRQLVAIDANMHADLEQMLLDDGAAQMDLWGINLYPGQTRMEDYIEFDSMINIRPRQNNRSRGVEDPQIRQQIIQVVQQWIH